jgi:signal transduction histidine kinase
VLLVAMYTVGAYRPLRFSWLIGPALVPYAVIAGNEAWRAERAGAGQFWAVLSALLAIYAMLIGGVWAVGYWAGLNRRRLAAAERRRAEAAVRAVNAERQRISGELHDIVAHAVTVMVLQASGAQRVLRRDPDRAAIALDQIAAQGQQAISELRRLLALLRDDESVGGPQPGLAELPALLDWFRDLGLTVHWAQSGAARAVDPSVGLAAYRTVQEALTNVVRHAGRSAQATVRLGWQPEQLSITVTDGGRAGGDQAERDQAERDQAGGHRPAAEPAARPLASEQRPTDQGTAHPRELIAGLSTGNGLAGLRERVRLIGGQLAAGPAEPAGFQVAATLPAVTQPVVPQLPGAGDPA